MSVFQLERIETVCERSKKVCGLDGGETNSSSPSCQILHSDSSAAPSQYNGQATMARGRDQI